MSAMLFLCYMIKTDKSTYTLYNFTHGIDDSSLKEFENVNPLYPIGAIDSLLVFHCTGCGQERPTIVKHMK